MQISFQDAYAEACQALGEEIVKARLLARTVPAGQEDAEATDPEQPEKQSAPKPRDMRNKK